LRMLKTGNKDQKTTYIKAIDDWIKVIDTHTDKKTRKKQTVKEEARKIQTAEKTQDNLMQCMGNKCSYTSFFSSFFFMFFEESEEIQIDSPSLNPPSIPSHSASITLAPFTAFNLDWRCSKWTWRIQEPKTTADNNSTDVVGLETALTKFVKVLTAWSQQQSRSEQMRKAEPTERVKRTEKAREKDSKILSQLNRLEKRMSAILQALERREKERE